MNKNNFIKLHLKDSSNINEFYPVRYFNINQHFDIQVSRHGTSIIQQGMHIYVTETAEEIFKLLHKSEFNEKFDEKLE